MQRSAKKRVKLTTYCVKKIAGKGEIATRESKLTAEKIGLLPQRSGRG